MILTRLDTVVFFLCVWKLFQQDSQIAKWSQVFSLHSRLAETCDGKTSWGVCTASQKMDAEIIHGTTIKSI